MVATACGGLSDKEMKIATRSATYFREAGEAIISSEGSCTVKTGTTSAGLDYSIACVDSNTFKITITQTPAFSGTCQGTDFSAANVTAKIDRNNAGGPSTLDMVGDVGEGTATDRKLNCKYTIEHVNGSDQVSNNACTLDDDEVDSEDLAGFSCD